MFEPLEVSGFVLAGGRSSRMGQNKALLELAGKPLVKHALTKLRRVCREVAILSNDVVGMSRFGRVVEDLHPDCGPMGGLEAALAAAANDWSLFVPVDVPFVPTALLYMWAGATVRDGQRDGTRVAMFRVNGLPQPTLVMLHREMAECLKGALAAGEYKLYPALRAGAEEVAGRHGLLVGEVLREWAWGPDSRFAAAGGEPPGPGWSKTTAAQEDGHARYFLNLNTAQEFAEAEGFAGDLDT